jgi:hypothetical protein
MQLHGNFLKFSKIIIELKKNKFITKDLEIILSKLFRKLWYEARIILKIKFNILYTYN